MVRWLATIVAFLFAAMILSPTVLLAYKATVVKDIVVEAPRRPEGS
jgi:hypothetical protein